MSSSTLTPGRSLTAGPGGRQPVEPRVLILAEVGASDVVAVMQSLRAALPAGTRLLTKVSARAEATASANHASTLNTRQWQIFALLAEGLTNKQIGRRLGLSHFTVRNHIGHILQAVGVKSRRQAAQTFATWADARSASAEKTPA